MTNKLFFIVIVSLLISCSSTKDENITEFRINFIDTKLSLTHNSHLGLPVLSQEDDYTITLDLQVFLSDQTDIEGIDKIRVVDSNSSGWNFNKPTVQQNYVDSTNSLLFTDLTFFSFINNPQEVFTVQLLDSENEVLFSRGIQLDYNMPLPTRYYYREWIDGIRTFFISYDEEYAGGNNESYVEQLTFYELLEESSTASLIWINESGDIISEQAMDLELLRSPFSLFDLGFYYDTPSADIPEQAFSYYTMFNKDTDLLTRRLVTRIDTLIFIDR